MLIVAMCCGPAWATTGHTFVGQFGGLGIDDGQFSEPSGTGPAGIAVMPSSGDVFTVDGNDGRPPRIQRFSAAGVFELSFPIDPAYLPVSAVAADPAGAGAVYVLGWGGAAPVAVLKYSASGTLLSQLDYSSSGTSINFSGGGVGGNAALAVDPSNGKVYVAATVTDPNSSAFGAQVIDSFDGTTGAFITSFDGASGSPDGVFQCPNGLAVDGSHRISVLDTCKNRVDQYDDTGAFAATIDDGSRGALSAVAVNPTSGEVYVTEPGPGGLQVTHFPAGGGPPVYTFDAANVGGVRGIAVSGVGTVYTADATNPVVERFTQFEGPTVVTGSGSAVDGHSVTLEGTINPEGVSSNYHFEYGLDAKYGSSTPTTSAGAGSVALAEAATISGLAPNTTYHYRIVGSNDSGSIVGADATFTTAAIPPTPDGSPAFASAITPRTATLHGTVNPNNSIALWHFEYGTSTAYGSSPDGLFFAVGGTDQAVAAKIVGLEPGTLYHFRVVASDLSGTDPQYGADQTFFTAPEAGGGAGDVTTRRATLRGTINPHGVATTYHFNYGPSTDYGSSTAEADGGAGDGDHVVSQSISGLEPSTTYHVQLVATSADGTTRTGADGLFRTAPAPQATVMSPTSVSTSTATLAGDVDTHGQAGTYHFELASLDGRHIRSTDSQRAAGGTSAQKVSAAVAGLPAGETFVVRLVVDSNDSTDVSDQITFATAPEPRVFPTAPTGDITSTYGCAEPRLDGYSARPKAGNTVTVTGHDLGAGGNVVLGDQTLVPTNWSATRFSLELPDDASGVLALTVNCGHRSNTIAIAIFHEPDNRFSVARRSVSGSTATLSVKVPGPGKLETSGRNIKATKATAKKAGNVVLEVRLSSAGAKALGRSRSHRLSVIARVRFTPAGGRSAGKTIALTYTHKAGR